MTEENIWRFLFWFYLVCGCVLAATFWQLHLPLFGKIFEGGVVCIVFGLAINAKTGWFFWT